MGKIEFTVNKDQAGMRLDHYLASNVKNISRSTIQKLIRDGQIIILGEKNLTKPSYRLHEQQKILLRMPDEKALTPKAITLNILYEDESIVVVNKSPGMVVHPGAGNHETTLVEGLLVDRDLPPGDDPVRPGIVHRLDKDTSGVMVIAKTYSTMNDLKAQFAHRKVCKLYVAEVEGIVKEEEGLIDAPIGRDAVNPRRMTITSRGRKALTEFRVIARTSHSTFLMVHLLTGRTHQIRLHMRYIGHLIIADTLYGNSGAGLMLHAWHLGFMHPESTKKVSFKAPLPSRFAIPGEISLPEIASKFHC